jgi:hypothetical protein
MTQADSVYITPPLNTSAIDHPMMFPPRDPTRRRFLTVAAVASAVGAGSLATAVAMDPSVPVAVTMPRHGRPDPAFALIAERRTMDIAYGEAIEAQDEAEGRNGFHSDETSEADDRCEAACQTVNAIDWKLATTPPTTLAGVAAVLGLPTNMKMPGANGQIPMRSGRTAGITSHGQPWRRRSRR